MAKQLPDERNSFWLASLKERAGYVMTRPVATPRRYCLATWDFSLKQRVEEAAMAGPAVTE
jgi:hypothetical protein